MLVKYDDMKEIFLNDTTYPSFDVSVNLSILTNIKTKTKNGAYVLYFFKGP